MGFLGFIVMDVKRIVKMSIRKDCLHPYNFMVGRVNNTHLFKWTVCIFFQKKFHGASFLLNPTLCFRDETADGAEQALPMWAPEAAAGRDPVASTHAVG